jgi:monoamine oxidase
MEPASRATRPAKFLNTVWTLAIGLACAVALACKAPADWPRAPEAPERPRVAIVGGGIAGLVAAYELEQRGISVQILEMNDRLGGRIATARYGQDLFGEYGMDEIWSKSPLAQLVRDLGLELDGGEGAFSSILRDGKVQAYVQDTGEQYLRSLFTDEEYTALARWMKQAESLHAELSTSGLTPTLAPLNDISFATWLERQALPPRVVAFIRMTLECELGGSAVEFSAISGLSEFRIFLFGGENALHIIGGNVRVVEALADRIRGPKTLGARVTAIERSKDADGRIQATVTYMKNSQVQSLTVERVIVAVPWISLHMIQLDPPLPPPVWESLRTLDRGQFTPVHFVVDKKVHSLWGGVDNMPFPVLTSGPLGVVYGIHPSPPTQPLEVFSLLVHGDAASAYHLMPREVKRQELLRELDAVWPGFSSFVRSTNIYTYHPGAVPLWPPGRSPYDAQGQLLFQAFDGLYLAGDYLVSSHSEGAVIAGRRQAAAIARELAPERP